MSSSSAKAGKQSDVYVKQAAIDCPYFVGGTHTSTWAVRYPITWVELNAQIAASHKCVNAMGEFMYNTALTESTDTLLVSMCAAPLVGMVQAGTEQEVLDTAAAADFAHRSKRAKKMLTKLHEEKNADGQSVHVVTLGTKLHEEKIADGQSVHAVKTGTKAHEEKNADGKSVHVVKLGIKSHEEKHADDKSARALKMASKPKYSAWTVESKANFECPNCSRLYFYATPLEKNGHKRKHQRCGNKAQILVPYHAVH
jgi:hypothetical protein